MKIILSVETSETAAQHVPFNTRVMYKCDPNTYIERNEIDPTMNNITVQCLTAQVNNFFELVC